MLWYYGEIAKGKVGDIFRIAGLLFDATIGRVLCIAASVIFFIALLCLFGIIYINERYVAYRRKLEHADSL